MGRKKSYDRTAVLEQAMRLFWTRGFHATTTRQLSDAMGVNVYSLYAEFGSKEGLFQAALAHYDHTIVTGHFGSLESPTAGLDDIRRVLGFFGTAGRDDNPMLGCLMTNALTEQAPTAASSRDTGDQYLQRLRGALAHALQGAVTGGELRSDTPIVELSNFLTATLLGVFVMLRSGADWQIMRDSMHQAQARLDGFALLPAPSAKHPGSDRSPDVQI